MHHTFNRVFVRLELERFQAGFVARTHGLYELGTGIELRLTAERYCTRTIATRDTMRCRWSVCEPKRIARVLLARHRVASGQNENLAIVGLLELLEIVGYIVTIDAIGCQLEMATQVVTRDADLHLPRKTKPLTTTSGQGLLASNHML